jgi:hypothetical protein
MDPDGPAPVRQHGCHVSVEQAEAADGGPDQKGDRSVEVPFICPGTATASGLWEHLTRWTHRSPDPGDPTEPPRARLLGGTGGSVVAEVADRQFRHLVSHDQDPGPGGSGR